MVAIKPFYVIPDLLSIGKGLVFEVDVQAHGACRAQNAAGVRMANWPDSASKSLSPVTSRSAPDAS